MKQDYLLNLIGNDKTMIVLEESVPPNSPILPVGTKLFFKSISSFAGRASMGVLTHHAYDAEDRSVTTHWEFKVEKVFTDDDITTLWSKLENGHWNVLDNLSFFKKI